MGYTYLRYIRAQVLEVRCTGRLYCDHLRLIYYNGTRSWRNK